MKASAIASEQSEAQPPPTFANWAAWNGYMSSVPAPHAGCFEVKYPSTVWQASKCGTAPLLPLQPSRASPSTVGNGNDWVAQTLSGKLIGSSVGSFPSITGFTSETDSKFGANEFGLQINSQTFTTSTTYTNDKSTTGWEQFVFINDPSGEYGTQIYIQYWLIGYYSAYRNCPSTAPPGGNGWYNYANEDCYANGPSFPVPTQTAPNLANLIQKGYANFASSNDEVVFCISGGSCYAVAIMDQVVDLYQYWTDAEFNVFGLGDGSQANFNSGTSISVVNALKDQSGNVIVPSCVNTGYTGETNNLNLRSCSSNGNGQIAFTESNAIATQVTMSVSYSVVGGGSPTRPVFHYVLNGASKSLTLTKTAKRVSVDAGSAWSVTPNPLGGSTPSQQWISAQTLTGTASATSVQFVFQHQYYLTMRANGSGSVAPSSGWYNAGQTVAIIATSNVGHKFNSWTGAGTGSYTGTIASNTITMKSAITETANFT